MKHRGLACQDWLALLAVLTLPAAVVARTPGVETPGLSATAVLQALNAYRGDQGLPPLAAAPGLQRLAAEHSVAMQAQGRLSHDGFARRFETAGGELCVENVAQGHRSPEQLIQGWRAVATHHRNLLEPRVAYAGIASQGRYVTYLACDVAGR